MERLQRTQQEDEYLNEIYSKARLLAYERQEQELVQHNQRLLRRRRFRDSSIVFLLLLVSLLILMRNDFDILVCFLLSSGIIAVGLFLENVELVRHVDLSAGEGKQRWM